jgi:PEP-CTERM motif
MIKTILAFTAVAAMTLPAHAVTVVQWDFENAPADLSNSTTSPAVAASFGVGTAVGVHSSSATDWTTPSGNGSVNSLSANTWGVGDYYQFSFGTVGYGGMLLSFDQTSSGTGPRDFTLAYSTDGSSFTNFASYAVLVNGSPNPSWSSSTYNSVFTFVFDLGGVAALNDQASVFLRLVDSSTVSANGGVVATGGTGRVDNFTVMLTPVPEASTTAMLLAGLAAVGFIARRRRG